MIRLPVFLRIVCGYIILVLVTARFSVQYPIDGSRFPNVFAPWSTVSNSRVTPRQARGRHHAVSRRRQSTSFGRGNDTGVIMLASSRSSGRESNSRSVANESTVSPASQLSGFERPKVSYEHLSPLGKVLAGSIEIAVVTLIEFASGFSSGYLLGTLTDVPRLLFRPAQPELRQALFKEVRDRGLRMHGKSFRWAKSWGGISAAFGGFRIATKVLRGGVEDEWSSVISSMAAGAYFARQGGPMAMAKSAVLYGGMIYVFSGGLGGSKKPFQYEEQPIEF